MVKCFLFISGLCCTLLASYSDDSLIVKAILDNNGCVTIPVQSISDSSEGRITGLYFSNLNLKELPGSIGKLSELRNLQVDRNKLTTLPVELEQCTYLEELNCSSNKLEKVFSGKVNLRSLVSVNLDSNNLSVLPEWLTRSPFIRTLSIKHNKINDISNLTGCKLLRYAHFDDNQIGALPANIGNLRNIEILTVSRNLLSQIPQSIGELENLRKLDLSHNRIQALPDSSVNCQALTDLYLDNNKLATFPVAIGTLSKLRWLYADNNRISVLPQSISDILSLQWVSLTGNTLTRLPDFIGDLKQLKILNLSSNKLISLPASIAQCTSLVMLEIDNNNITSLPAEIISLHFPSIKHDGIEHCNLGLSNNQICTPDEKVASWADRCCPGWRESQRCDKNHSWK